MKFSSMEQREINLAVEKALQKRAFLTATGHDVKLGEGGEALPPDYVETDALLGRIDRSWPARMEPELTELDQLLRKYLRQAPRPDRVGLPKLTAENLWVWGGPTPYWGGSMADDTLVRGADYFEANNVVYVYGPTDEKMLGIHADYARMICQVNANCRSPQAQSGASDAENAEILSRLSLQYPNIIGAMCDDLRTGFHRILLPEKFADCYRALKKHNPKLLQHAVVYAHELDLIDFSQVVDYVDVVNLWFWHRDDVLEYDEKLARARQCFPGKPIMQGIFLHDYGVTDCGNMIEMLLYQLDKAREYIALGVVQSVVLLGDREIKKWPSVACAIKKYLDEQ